PQQILEVRRLVTERAPSARRASIVAKIAMRLYASRTLFALGTRIAGRVTAPWRDASGRFTRLPSRLADTAIGRRYLAWRTPPAIASTPARSLVKRAAPPPAIPGSP